MSTYAENEHLCAREADQRVANEERAAIKEYDGGLSQTEAEGAAAAEFPEMPDFLRRQQ